MTSDAFGPMLERKFCSTNTTLSMRDGVVIEGYASLFGKADQGGDVVMPGAYEASLAKLASGDTRVKMLWQHDPSQPIGVWEDVREDEQGLYVKGRLLMDVEKGREASALIEAGAIDGLSIGYRTKRAEKDAQGRRLLHDLELWEVSLVTFPMLPDARVGQKADEPEADLMRELAEVFHAARLHLAGE
jgi:HK97 family phage prohead protease